MFDVQVWTETRVEGQCQVRHTFFEKSMASPFVFHSRSSYNWKAKILTLGEEVKMRLMNMDRTHSEQEKVREIKTFLIKMANSGYRPPTRKEVVLSRVRRYYRKLLIQESGGPRL